MTLDDILLFVLANFGPFTVNEEDFYEFLKNHGEYKVFVQPLPDTLQMKIGVEEVVSGESGE